MRIHQIKSQPINFEHLMLEGTYNLILDQDLHFHTSLVTSLVLMSQSQISKHASIAYTF